MSSIPAIPGVDPAWWHHIADPGVMLDWLEEHWTLSDRKTRLLAVSAAGRVVGLAGSDFAATASRLLALAARHADGAVRAHTLSAAYQAASRMDLPSNPGSSHEANVACTECARPDLRCRFVLGAAARARAMDAGGGQAGYAAGKAAERAAQAGLVRCLFGDPGAAAPVAADPAWLAWNDRTVPRLARLAYDRRDWGRLPILADALEEAGCPAGGVCDVCGGAGMVSLPGKMGGPFDDDSLRLYVVQPSRDEEVPCHACGGRGRCGPGVLEHLRTPGPHARGCWVLDMVLGKS